MKKTKLLLSIAALSLLCAGTVMAYDATANIRMSGSLMSATKNNVDDNPAYSFFNNNPVNQKDNPGDGIEVDFDAGIAGAHLALWYKTATDNGADANELDDWTAHFRRTYVWFSPIDMIKFRLGYVGNDTFFKERIDQWKVGSPFSLTGRDWMAHPAYINCNDVEGWGFGLEVRPIDALVFNAGISPAKKGGFSSSATGGITFTTADDLLVAPWGAGVKYYWNNFEFQASYRRGVKGSADTGDNTNEWSVARFGAGYSDSSVYAFIQPIIGFDYSTEKAAAEVTGLCLDLYGEYYFDAWTFMLHAPLTFRFTGNDGDCNYLEWVALAKYNLGSFGNVDDLSPYVKAGSIWDDVNVTPQYRAWRLDETFSDYFNMSYAGGVTFSVANCKVDVALQMTNHCSKSQLEWEFALPFNVKITF